MNILVTGAAGFVGTNLCKDLLEQGHTVYGVDNFITGQEKNAELLSLYKKFHFTNLDITKEFIERFKNIPINRIYHLACPTGVPNIERLGEEMMALSSYGTRNVLELAKLHKAKMLFTSSCEVYGNPEVFPQTEEYNGNVSTIGDRSAYEVGKRFSESLIALYVRKYNVDAKIVRIFNTYGPGMSPDDTRVIPSFINSVLNNKVLIVYGDGIQTRTHLYIDDLIRGLQLVINKGKRGEIYNIGSVHQVTVRDLAVLIIKLSGSKSHIIYKDHFIEDHQDRLPCVKKIKKLGWNQELSLEDGIIKTINSYKK